MVIFMFFLVLRLPLSQASLKLQIENTAGIFDKKTHVFASLPPTAEIDFSDEVDQPKSK